MRNGKDCRFETFIVEWKRDNFSNMQHFSPTHPPLPQDTLRTFTRMPHFLLLKPRWDYNLNIRYVVFSRLIARDCVSAFLAQFLLYASHRGKKLHVCTLPLKCPLNSRGTIPKSWNVLGDVPLTNYSDALIVGWRR